MFINTNVHHTIIYNWNMFVLQCFLHVIRDVHSVEPVCPVEGVAAAAPRRACWWLGSCYCFMNINNVTRRSPKAQTDWRTQTLASSWVGKGKARLMYMIVCSMNVSTNKWIFMSWSSWRSASFTLKFRMQWRVTRTRTICVFNPLME